MSRIPIIYKLKYSYKVNNELTTISFSPDAPYYITINSSNAVKLILTPVSKNSIKWTDIMTYNLEIKNLTESPIENFCIKLDTPSNLSYINGSLVNASTGTFYPLKDWKNEYNVLDTIPARGSLNVKYSIQVNPNEGTSVETPIAFNNSGYYDSTPVYLSSNYSSLNISEPRIIYDTDNYTLQNTGTIPYSFTHKFIIPEGKIYTKAMLDDVEFNDIFYRKLGPYAIFTITLLPPKTINIPNLLRIIFE